MGSFDKERERRRKWAREVLGCLGFGMARDESGFYRPAKLTTPGEPAGKRRLPVDEQLKLNFEQEQT